MPWQCNMMLFNTWLFVLYYSSLSFSKAEILIPRIISPDNTCGKNGTGAGADAYTCPQTLPCCSANGYCGSDSSYCLTTAGCQANFGNCTASVVTHTVSPDFTCGLIGAGENGYTCSAGAACCSAKYLKYMLLSLRFSSLTSSVVDGVVIPQTIVQ